MNNKKLIRYRISISWQFPSYHRRKGQPTYFQQKIESGSKIHTIRANYDLWAKRFEKIQAGEACIELYYWKDKPYKSKPITFKVLTKEDVIGLQKLEFEENKDGVPKIKYPLISNFAEPEINNIAINDGLSLEDFKEWFKKSDLSEPMAIIHFTDFRY